MDTTIILIAAFGAQIIGTIAGFGSATVLTPVAGSFLDFKTAIALVATFHLFGNLSKVIHFRNSIDWKIFLQFGLASILLTILGATLSTGIDSVFIKGIFGGFLIIYVVISLISPSFGMKASFKTSLLGGALSGFIAGLIGTGGATRSAFLTSFHLEKQTYIATSAIIAIVIDAIRIPIYMAGGALSEKSNLILIPLLIITAFVATSIGKKLVAKLSGTLFHRIVMGLLFLTGLKFIWDGFKGAL